MIHAYLRQSALAATLVAIVAFGTGACSADRAILAPSDALISLDAGAPLMVINDATTVEIEVVTSDGSPVRDGTEVVVTASRGELDHRRVRTSGGWAKVGYRAAPEPGTVEFQAISDAAQGTLILVIASAPVDRVTITASPTLVPVDGGEIALQAKVLSASGEPVIGAPVTFTASAGSVTPTDAVLTNDQGEATAQLAATAAATVRARVQSVESAALELELEENSPTDPGLPFKLSDVTWLHADLSEWAVTSQITNVRIDHDTICLDHTKKGQWPVRGAGEGNPWVLGNVGGKWYAATYEYLRPGQICKHITRRGEWGIGPHTKKPPLESWAPRKGELVGFMVSAFARDSTRTVPERSNIVMVEWPY